VISQRKPRLVEFAEHALSEGAALIELAVVYRTLRVETLTHEW
jgi:hypothetical protein